MSASIDKLADTYFDTMSALHSALGYKEDWVPIPMADHRDDFWMLPNGEGSGGRVVYSSEPFTKETIEAGEVIYSGSIYTQRFLPKWVYRDGKTHVLISVDTHTDGVKELMLFDADKECTDDELRKFHEECW